MLDSRKPVVAVCAVRTGAGKSATTRKVCSIISGRLGKRVVVVRHPMPITGTSRSKRSSVSPLSMTCPAQECTIEERESEPLIDQGLVVYASMIMASYSRVRDGGRRDSLDGATTIPVL